jgi:hypothetical protein
MAVSADNEIAILEMTDADGHKSYRVAESSTSYLWSLSPEMVVENKEEILIVYKNWKDAKEFYHSKDAHEYARSLEEDCHYVEYGITSYSIDKDWEGIEKRFNEIKCQTCEGDGWRSNDESPALKPCADCGGKGYK